MILNFLEKIFAFDSHSPLLFTQFYFWAFFACVFAVFSLLHNKVLMRNTFLCFVSLFFYYKTSGLFVLILIFTTIFNFFQAQWIDQSATNRKRSIHLATGLIVNLFFLCYFKYAYFFTDIVNGMLGTHFQVFDSFSWIGNLISGKERFDVSNILLPVGISFYTFQNISYLMDIFRKRIKPVGEILNFGFYVCFFPQLVAGPIIRASEFVPQIYRKYYLNRRVFGMAVFWILNGLAKKIVLSDYIAVNFVDRVFENPSMYTGFENLMALFGYSLQVYADFSGYTDIAIGVAMLMGFYLPKNFNSPYKATNVGDFWKRWHISLSKWLQDYLYIPLGGNRSATVASYLLILTLSLIAVILSGSVGVGVFFCILLFSLCYMALKFPYTIKKLNTYVNLMNTMLIGGIWHGASWNFMIWGGLNGLGLIVYKGWKNISNFFRIIFLSTALCGAFFFAEVFKKPILDIVVAWVVILWFSELVKCAYRHTGGRHFPLSCIDRAWAVIQTFVFISFTRLFFRSGSNLNPAEANEVAYTTAGNMVAKIGSYWNLSQIGAIVSSYRSVFLMIAFGLIIHWLPERFKRRYRLWFASLPLAVMAVVVVISVFIIYQFITADLQSFIYFQF